MRQIEKEERLLFDDLVLSDDELFLVRGGATRSCGSNCGSVCGTNCGINCGNTCGTGCSGA